MQCRMFELHVPDKPRFFNFLAPEILRNIDNFFAAAERIPTRPFVWRWSLDADSNQVTLRRKKL